MNGLYQWSGLRILYDAAGNLQSVSSKGFTYDAEGRVTGQTDSNGSTVSITYDGDGHRVSKTVGSSTTVYAYDPLGQLAAEFSATAPLSTNEYLTQDHLGSTRLTTDPTATALGCHDYLPFGEEIPSSWGRSSAICYDQAETTLKFTGKERDSETGLDFFGARYFSSAQGRFTSPDAPFAGQATNNPQSWNLYSYSINNPLRFTDPSGHDPSDQTGDDTSCGVHMKDCGPEIGPLPQTSSLGQTQDRAIGAVKGFFGGILDTAEFLGAPSQNVNQIKDFLHLWPSSQNQSFGGEIGGFVAMLLPSGGGGVVAKGAKTWQEAGISASDALRIQNAADKTRQTIVVIGSRASGTAEVTSDWDYVLSGASRARSSASNSLPTGTAGGAIKGMQESGIDIFQSYNPSAPNFTRVDPSLPHVIFTPRK